MIGRLTEEQLVQIRRRESDEFISCIRRTELAQVESKVPSAWIALARAPGPDSARAVLGDLSTHLPRFVDYVSASIAGCAIVEVDAGLPILVMYFPDWVEKDIDKLVGGACVAGVPSEAAALSRF